MTRAVLLETRALQIGSAHALCAPLDLSLAARELLLVSGDNGVGKSTLLRTLAGEQAPLAGQLLTHGSPRIRHLPQHAGQQLSGPFSVADLLRLNGQGDLQHPWVPAQRRQRVDRLSGGQRQRLLLAMLLSQPGDLLLLDEPGQYLDQPSQAQLQDWLAEPTAALGMAAVVMVSHDQLHFSRAQRLHLQGLADG